jgi:hypothetical protein
MLTFTTTTIVFFALFFAVAAIAAITAVAAAFDFVASNRRTRLARRESFRSYYGGLVLHH